MTTLETYLLVEPSANDVTRIRQKHFVCIPSLASNCSAHRVDEASSDLFVRGDTDDDAAVPQYVFEVLSGERLYDLGWKRNICLLMKRPLILQAVTEPYVFNFPLELY